MLTDEIESIYKKYNRSKYLSPFTGISDEEISNFEHNLSIIFPDNYKQILRVFGPEINKELAPGWGPIDIYEMQTNAIEMFTEFADPENKLPEKCYVFYCSDEGFCFFIADGMSNDPQVYSHYFEHSNFDTLFPSLSEWYLHHAKMRAKARIR